MTIEKIKEEKEKLELEIGRKVTDFEKATGTQVSCIRFSKIYYDHNKFITTKVQMEVLI